MSIVRYLLVSKLLEIAGRLPRSSRVGQTRLMPGCSPGRVLQAGHGSHEPVPYTERNIVERWQDRVGVVHSGACFR